MKCSRLLADARDEDTGATSGWSGLGWSPCTPGRKRAHHVGARDEGGMGAASKRTVRQDIWTLGLPFSFAKIATFDIFPFYLKDKIIFLYKPFRATRLTSETKTHQSNLNNE